jgi:hypothetical protein
LYKYFIAADEGDGDVLSGKLSCSGRAPLSACRVDERFRHWLVEDVMTEGDTTLYIKGSCPLQSSPALASSLVLGHAMARMGAQIILSPCAWAMLADHEAEKLIEVPIELGH